jgi:hypothetical protein
MVGLAGCQCAFQGDWCSRVTSHIAPPSAEDLVLSLRRLGESQSLSDQKLADPQQMVLSEAQPINQDDGIAPVFLEKVLTCTYLRRYQSAY